MKYIELFGLPGAGKTTISVPVINILRNEGYSVAGLPEVYFRKCKNGKKNVWMEMMLSLRYYPVYFCIFNYGLVASKSAEGMRFALKLIFLVHQIIKTEEEKKYDIVLCEEGVIQYLTSICYLERLPDNKQFERAMLCIKRTLSLETVECVVNINEALDRICERKGTSQRFSARTSRPQLEKALQIKKENLSMVSGRISSVHVLLCGTSIDDNINALLSIVRKIII